MANPRLTRWLLLAGLAFYPAKGWCTGGWTEEAPPTLPYYLDRLPAKPPSLIFEETFSGPTAPAKPVDFKAALLGLAGDCEKGVPPAKLIATTDDLLAQARLDAFRAAALSNILNDVRDLFSAPAPVTGKLAAGYIRWRVEHADWFHIAWDKPKPVVPDEYAEDVDKVAQSRLNELEANLKRCEGDPASKPLCVHWLFLCGAIDFPGGGAEQFKEVTERYPDNPRAEAARFLLARCVFNAARAHDDSGGAAAAEDLKQARAMFADYLKRYPQGRFAADVPGWLGAIAFLGGDYLGALDFYLQQADMPGHPEVLKSAGFMCERCLARLAAKGDQAALDKVATHPRLAMSLIYLVVNSPEANYDDDKTYTPAQVSRWRRALLPRLADAVAAHADAYKSADWQPRYLALLAQAASAAGDQAKALSLCDMGKDQITHCDDLAFIRLVALARAHKLPEAIAAGRDFARLFPKSPLAPGAALRTALALQDNHQAGAAIGELIRLQNANPDAKKDEDDSEEMGGGSTQLDAVYPYADGNLPASQSSVQRDVSGAETAQLAQLIDALLNFAPLPELAAALDPGAPAPLNGADAANLRAVLVQRWLAEGENFDAARKYATPAQWSVAAEPLAQLTAAVSSAPAGPARATACSKLAEAWADRRGQVVFAPLETDDTRSKLFHDDAKAAGLARRKNGIALGISPEVINHALSTRDEWQHAFAWQLKAADAAPEQSPERAKALWAALRMMPAMALASPYTFLRAGETDATALSRRLYDRLRRECPQSREARELAVCFDLAPPPAKAADSGSDDTGDADDKEPPLPDLSAASGDDSLPYGELEYRWTESDPDGSPPDEDPAFDKIQKRALALNSERYFRDPNRLRREVATLRAQLRSVHLTLTDVFLVNYLDDLGDLLDEPDPKHTPEILGKYVPLRVECLSVEHWGFWPGDGGLPPVPGATEGTLNETFREHIRVAYHNPALGQIHDYLDFLGLALVANSNINVPIPGEMQDAKDGTPGKREPVTYESRDYEKLAKLAEGFLADYPQSRKRDAARLLEARALNALYRPQMYMKWAAWPESGHFASGNLLVSIQTKAVDAKRFGAALNAYDREFPNGRYAADIRNLRGILAWRTQDWPRALALTLQTLDDKNEPVLQDEAAKRLYNIFMDGLRDETERAHLIAAVKSCPGAPDKLRTFVPNSAYPVQAMRSWILAQL